jgi:hypothetical protein
MRRWIWKIPLIVALVWFAVWWQAKQEAERAGVNAPAKVSPQSGALFAGHWRGEIAYPSGAKHSEEFFFQLEGGNIYGMATYGGSKRGIEDAQLVGDTLKFKLRYEDKSDRTVQTGWTTYEARRIGDEVQLQIFDSRSNLPVEGRLTRTKDADGAP